jgi:hypothetical protein
MNFGDWVAGRCLSRMISTEDVSTQSWLTRKENHDPSSVTMSCQWYVSCGDRMRNNSRDMLACICFSSTVKKWGAHCRWRFLKRRDWVGCRQRVDRRRHVPPQGLPTNENGRSARSVKIASSKGMDSTVAGSSQDSLSWGRSWPYEHTLSLWSKPSPLALACIQDHYEWHQAGCPSCRDRRRLSFCSNLN